MKSDTDFANPYERDLYAQEEKIKELTATIKELNQWYEDEHGRRVKLEEKLKVAVEVLEFYGSWKSYGSSEHPFLERYSAEVMLDSSEIEYTELDGNVFKETFAGKRAREALEKIKGTK